MCGVLLVRSHALLNHQPALAKLSRRGPDFTVSRQIGSTFVAQTVLHITGSDDFYLQPHSHGFSYNGEIYNYQSFGKFSNDVELAYLAATNDPRQFENFVGPWSWCLVSNDTVLYASDPQGERCLYQYQDDDMLIVCSEVAPILTYLTAQHVSVPYNNKCWSMIDSTPWRGISRCRPGVLYKDGKSQQSIDSIFDWIKQPLNLSLNEALEQFEFIWQTVGQIIAPRQQATLSYSGGIDSELVNDLVTDLDHLTVDIVGKDPIVAQLDSKKITVTPQQWAEHYQQLIEATDMPVQTWSYVGKWLIAQHSANSIIFTGLAADELFGGYPLYQTITYDSLRSHSPYSSDDHDNLWNQCLDVYNGDPKAATLLMDYWYQVVGVDAPGLDRLGGFWGKETRNPFMCKPVMQFALNLPWHLRAGYAPKILLKTLYQRKIAKPLMNKQGFAGHANDSLPWLDVNIDLSGDRYQDWKKIAQHTFRHYTQRKFSMDSLDS